MPMNGSGSYVPPAPEFPAIPNTIIYAADFNQIILDIASALSLAIFRDGQAAFLANQSMGSNKLTNLAAGTDPADAVNWQQVFVNPTFTGTTTDGVKVQGTRLTVGTVDVVLPALTTIGTRNFGDLLPSIAELNFVDGVTSPIQVQIDAESAARIAGLALKANLAGGNTFTGTQNFPADTLGVTAALGDQSLKFATTQFTATAIAAAVSAVGFTDVVFLNSASSPYNITQADAGKLLLIDTTGGNVTVNLPLISGLALPFLSGVKKGTSDANTVTVNCTGGNTFDDGTTSKALSTPSGFTLLPDVDPAPDVWAAIGFGGINAGPITNSGLTESSGTMLGRQSPGSGAIEEIPTATQAEMGAGVVTNMRAMTPLGVAQAITAQAVLPAAAQTLTNKTITYADNTLTGVAGTTATQTLTNKTIEAGTFTNGYTEEVATANTSTAYTIDLANGSVQYLTLTGNCTYTFPTPVAGKSFTLIQKQDGTGGRTVTWPASVKWPGGTAPTLTSTASKADKFIFTAIDGSSWLGSNGGQNYTV